MSKKVLAVCAAAVAVIVLAGVFLNTSMESIEDTTPMADSVSITMSSSRPGCEADNTCYVPNQIVVDSGQTVTWINDDSAFHTVTSGHYDEHDGMFDSGQLDPAQKFSHTFAESGQFSYYCRLHPWMEGEVIIK